MNWILILTLIGTNLIFGLCGYFLGQKIRRRKEVEAWAQAYEHLRQLRKNTQEEVEQQLKELETERILFEQASWNEKLKILGGKKE